MNYYIISQNKYQIYYNNIIKNAKIRNWTKKTAICYTEKHHILPKCLGGDNSELNLVCLTAKEHYVCHKLLTKFYVGIAKHKMVAAFYKMCVISKDHKNQRFIRSIDYEKYKKLYSESCSVLLKGRKNPKVSIANKNRIWKEESKRKISQNNIGKSHTLEQLEKMSIANKHPHNMSEKGKLAIINSNKRRAKNYVAQTVSQLPDKAPLA